MIHDGPSASQGLILTDLAREVGTLAGRLDQIERRIDDMAERAARADATLQQLADVPARLRVLVDAVGDIQRAADRAATATAERDRLIRAGRHIAAVLLAVGAAGLSAAVWLAERWDAVVQLFRRSN